MQIRQYVAASGVSPEQVDVVTRTVCVTLAALMNDPTFTNQLVVVHRLQEENQWLRTQYTILKQMLSQVGVQVPRKRAPAKKAPARKKAPTAPRVKGGTTRQRQAFQAGYRGR
jgi:hypothetical protein